MKEHEVFEMRMWKGSLNRYTTTNKRGIHMDSTWINAPAKINLGLDVIRRRDDGYHEVKMIMQSIRLFDRLTLKKTKTPDISLTTNLHFLPVNEDNLVYKSAKCLWKNLEFPKECRLRSINGFRLPPVWRVEVPMPLRA